MDDGIFIRDFSSKSFGNVFKVSQLLCDQQSEFQRIQVFDTEDVGRILMLDTEFNVSTVMEAYYHEPMAHIPLAMVERAQQALLIGGGDFGIARQALKHESLERFVQCELDPQIIEVCKRYFPEWAEPCEADGRFESQVGDGFAYLENQPPESLDILIVDSTDPGVRAPVLLSEEFYDRAYRALKPGGVMFQMIGDNYFYVDAWRLALPRVRERFQAVAPAFVPVPFYVTGDWGLLLAGKERDDLDPTRVSESFLSNIPELKTMTPQRVAGWFSLPPITRKAIGLDR